MTTLLDLLTFLAKKENAWLTKWILFFMFTLILLLYFLFFYMVRASNFNNKMLRQTFENNKRMGLPMEYRGFFGSGLVVKDLKNKDNDVIEKKDNDVVE